MALLKRELYRQAKGPKVTHADCCTLVFDTDTKDLYVEREVVHLEAKTGHGRVPDSHDGYSRLLNARRAKLPITASYGACWELSSMSAMIPHPRISLHGRSAVGTPGTC